MKITLSALLLAGAVSAATAAPRDEERTGRVSYTKETKAPKSDWVELATPTPAAHGRTFVTLDTEEVPFTILRIDAHKGHPVIKQVRVVFADGKQRIVKVGKRLDRGRSAYVDLRGGKEIESIIVDTDHRTKGSYTIHGAPVRTAIATR